MAIQVGGVLRERLGELRFEPSARRVRAVLGGAVVGDSTEALLVWEPRRVVPVYALPERDLDAELLPAPEGETTPAELPPVLSVGRFGWHTAPGEAVTVRAANGTEAAGFRPADPDLAGYVVLDFRAFDAWYEEDERVVSHPRDPYHRVDALRSSRHVRIELDGELLAESSQPTLVFETNLPMRCYLPRADVRMDLLTPSERRTFCAYKGEASYFSVPSLGRAGENLVWTYEQPLPDGPAVDGLVAFFDERVDVVVDGERRERPWTEWAPPRS